LQAAAGKLMMWAPRMRLESNMRKDKFDPDAMAQAGRERAALELNDLMADWVSAFKVWALSHGATGSRELNDLSAEFQLRNIELPFDQVREEQRALLEEMLKVGSDNSGILQAAADFLNELGGPNHSRALSSKRPERNRGRLGVKRGGGADGETAA
jgi:hypothetical protein